MSSGCASFYSRMFPSLSPASYVADDLISLAEVMLDDPENPSAFQPTISLLSGLLYLAQFLDHDLSLDITPLARASNITPEKRLNHRSPFLDLDSLYGSGPDLCPYLYYLPAKRGGASPPRPGQERFLIGKTHPSRQSRDLPRTSAGRPILAEARNEENLILRQLHVVLLLFHNKVIEALESGDLDAAGPGETVFLQAQRLVKWHYQYIVLNDLLYILLDRDVLQEELEIAAPIWSIPIEFALAAFRVGHTMVRNNYQMNDAHQDASLEQLLNLNSMGNPPLRALPDEWVIDWQRFFEEFRLDEGEVNRSRGMDTHIAKALHNLPFGVPMTSGPDRRILHSLPAINLLRGARSGLPSGQKIAEVLEEKKLTDAELQFDQSKRAKMILGKTGMLTDTPLWFYILQEGAAREGKKGLGRVGSRIVARTIVGLLKADSTSILGEGRGWHPPVWKRRGLQATAMFQLVGIALDLPMPPA